MASETGRMSVSVSVEKQEKLDAIAQNADRSRNWIVNQAIDQYLDLYEWQEQKIKARLEELESGKAKFASDEDLDALIEKYKS